MDSDFNARLPTNRRTDILRQLNVQLPDVLPRLFQVMARTYEGEWRRSLSQTLGWCRARLNPPSPLGPARHSHSHSHLHHTAGRQADPATAAEVLKAALQLLKRLVQWLSPDLLMRPEMNFLQVFWCVVCPALLCCGAALPCHTRVMSGTLGAVYAGLAD